MSRAPKSPAQPASVALSIRLSAEAKRRLYQLAGELRVPPALLARNLLLEALDREMSL